MPFLEATRRPMLHRILLVALTAGVSCWGDEPLPDGISQICSAEAPCPSGLECVERADMGEGRFQCEIPCSTDRDCPNIDCWLSSSTWCREEGFCEVAACL